MDDLTTHMKTYLILILIILTCSSCQRSQPLSEKASEAIRVPLVKTIELKEVQSVQDQAFPGIAKEGRTVKQSFRVAGPLVQYDIQIGKRLRKGDLLAQIDQRDYLLAIQQVEAELSKAESTLQAMKTGARPEDVAALEAKLAAAQSQFQTAQTNETRFASLLKTQAVAQFKYDEIKLLRDQAKAALEAGQKELDKAKIGARKEDIAAMEAGIAALQAQRQKAKNALTDTKLLAPSDGYVSQKYMEEGEIAAPGIPVLAFTDISEIRVQTTIPESLLLRKDDIVSYRCQFDALPGKTFTAQLHELGFAMQAGKQGYPMELELEDASAEIHPGMVATITLGVNSHKTGFVVPPAALAEDPSKPDEAKISGVLGISSDRKNQNGEARFGQSKKTCVWRISGAKTAQSVPVRPLRFTELGVEIAGELNPGERIVAAGARFLSEGQRVRTQ